MTSQRDIIKDGYINDTQQDKSHYGLVIDSGLDPHNVLCMCK
jgi:hypothetical protein